MIKAVIDYPGLCLVNIICFVKLYSTKTLAIVESFQSANLIDRIKKWDILTSGKEKHCE